jgi:hypothetical protein
MAISKNMLDIEGISRTQNLTSLVFANIVNEIPPASYTVRPSEDTTYYSNTVWITVSNTPQFQGQVCVYHTGDQSYTNADLYIAVNTGMQLEWKRALLFYSYLDRSTGETFSSHTKFYSNNITPTV